MIPGLLGALSSSQRITDISGCVLLCDASTIVGLSGGAQVAPWADLSGSNNHWVTDGSNPVYSTNGINGHPAVSFSAASSQRLKTTNALNVNFPFTVFIVSKATAISIGAGAFVLLFSNSAGTGWTYVLMNGARDFTAMSVNDRLDGSATTGVELISLREVSGLAQLWLNGVEQTLSNSTNNQTEGTGIAWLGSDKTPAAFFDGLISDVALFNVALSPVNRMTVERILSTKLGITIDQSPVNTVAPAISAAGWTVGQVASCDTGTWTNEPTTYTYQWYLEVSEATYNQITGATNSTLLLTAPMVGLKVQCRVAASNAFAGPTEAQSADSDQIV